MTDEVMSPVVLVCNTAWGLANFRQNIIEDWVSKGIEVFAVAPYEARSVARIEAMGARFLQLNLDNRGANPVRDMSVVIQLYRYYRQLRPRLVVHYTIKPVIYGGWAASLAGVPSLAVITGLGYTFINSGIKAVVAKLLYKTSLRLPEEVWFLNEADRGLFVEKGLLGNAVTRVMPGEGVDVDFFSPRAKRSDSKVVKLLLVARLLYDKGIGEFAEAGRRYALESRDSSGGHSVEFQLLGPYYPENPKAIAPDVVEGWVRDGCLNYLGQSDDVRAFLSECDALVLPSYGEGIPRTVLEAMSMGIPVIATNVSGCRDLVVDGVTGILCDAKCVESLRGAVARFLSLDNEARISMGEAGRGRVVEEFSDEKVVSFYGNFFYRLKMN